MAQRHYEALARGRAAEWKAALWLRAKGYRILARSFRVAGGELDIVAREWWYLSRSGRAARWKRPLSL
jgi:Holliday junction resolvase-like predicted endonuclease